MGESEREMMVSRSRIDQPERQCRPRSAHGTFLASSGRSGVVARVVLFSGFMRTTTADCGVMLALRHEMNVCVNGGKGVHRAF